MPVNPGPRDFINNIGQERTLAPSVGMSAFRGKAVIAALHGVAIVQKSISESDEFCAGFLGEIRAPE